MALGLLLATTLAASPAPTRTEATEPPGRVTRSRARGPEWLRFRVVNRYFGAISVSRDGGRSWSKVGKVLRPDPGQLHAIGDMEFTAADWAPVGSVAATAVNAMHIKVSQGSHAVVFSLLPGELATEGPAGSYRDAAASVLTDVPAGHDLFGPEASPRVGDELFLETFPGGQLEPWPEGRAPQLGDRLVVVCREPMAAPEYVEIENRWGGLVTAVRGERSEVVGRVYRPMGGSGRFGGTVFQGVGRVRANHPGVLCVSTSPVGELGGFQLVPAFHANAPSLTYVKSTTAYLVVGPADLADPPLEGRMPLFLGLFRPGDRVMARVAGHWGEVPEVVGKVASGLEKVEAIRLLPSTRLAP